MLHRLSLGLLLGTSALLAGPVAADTAFDPRSSLPDIGGGAGTLLSAEEERRLGQEFMRSVRQSVRLVEDPEVEDYIQSLGQRLASHVDNRSHEYTFFVVDDPSINAFAGPGGFIGVHSGLLAAAESENELAAVLAHEIAHVSQRHLNRSFENLQRMSIPTMAAIIAAIILSGRDSEAGMAALTASMAGSLQSQLNFTRAHEQEADRVGIQLLADAGYDPRSMAAFFNRLEQMSRYDNASVPELLRTHPITLNRIADAGNRAERYPTSAKADNLYFQLTRAKLRALTAQEARRVSEQRVKAITGQPALEHAERYGLALALLNGGDATAARKELRAIIRSDQERIPYLDALARSELALKNVAEAQRIYRDALGLHPYNRQLTIGYAQTLLQTGQPSAARALLEEFLRRRGASPAILRLKAEAEDATHAAGAAHVTLADFYYLNGQVRAAIDHLNIALKQPDTGIHERAQIEARLRQLKDEALNEQQAADQLAR